MIQKKRLLAVTFSSLFMVTISAKANGFNSETCNKLSNSYSLPQVRQALGVDGELRQSDSFDGKIAEHYRFASANRSKCYVNFIYGKSIGTTWFSH